MKKFNIKNIKNKKRKAFFIYLVGKVLALAFIFFSLVLLLVPTMVLAAESVTILDNRAESIDGKSVKVIWRTDVGTKGKIIFGETAQDLHYYIVDGDGYKTYHEVELANLKPETTYYYQIIAYSTYEQATSFLKSFKTEKHNDGIGPQVSDLSIPFVSGNLALISWKTDEAGTSVVEYSENESYASRAYNNTRTQEHNVILKNLKVDHDYFVRVYSVDKDNNRSAYNYRRFRTQSNNNIDKADLEIKNFRPAGLSDAQVTAASITVTFQTNRYAKGKVTISRSGFRSQSHELDYNSTHRAAFSELSPETQYKITINLNDVFGKSKTEVFEVSTKSVMPATTTNTVSKINNAFYSDGNINDNLNFQSLYLKSKNQGNLPKIINSSEGEAISLDGKDNYLEIPFENGLNKLPLSFVVFTKIEENDNQWQAIFSRERSKGSPWLYRLMTKKGDGTLFFDMADNKNRRFRVTSDYKINDNQWHLIIVTISEEEVKLYADGKFVNGEKFSDFDKGFYSDQPLWLGMSNYNGYSYPLKGLIGGFKYYNYILSLEDGEKIYNLYFHNNKINIPANLKDDVKTSSDNNIIVAGAEHSYYTKATALLKTYDSPDIYAIMNGQRHYISSPASFAEYGFNWLDIKTVTRAELEKYPRARLIKGPEKSTIYYLYQRPEGQWLKINITSPTVFVSYPKNYWGNVITVTELDVNSYPDVRLVKTKNSSEIYYLEKNSRRRVSVEVFKAHGFNIYEVSEISDTHLESYLIGNPLN